MTIFALDVAVFGLVVVVVFYALYAAAQRLRSHTRQPGITIRSIDMREGRITLREYRRMQAPAPGKERMQ